MMMSSRIMMSLIVTSELVIPRMIPFPTIIYEPVTHTLHTNLVTFMTQTQAHRDRYHFLHFGNLIFGTPHTQIHTDTCTHTDTIFTFLHSLGIHAKDILVQPQMCTCTDTHTCPHLENPYTRQEDRKFKGNCYSKATFKLQ